MTKKKRQRKEERHQAHGHAPQLPAMEHDSPDSELIDFPSDPRVMERMTSRVSRLLSEQGINSEAGMNEFMNDFVLAQGGSLDELPGPVTPLEKAQDLMYDAFEADDPQKRVRLARKALKTSPDCADAYVLLAEETADTAEEARALYQKGVEAGERALGEDFFTEEAGNFWGILETRPYMRARQGLAQTQWALGEQDKALANYRQMLELNPGDNQGIRYSLSSCLQVAGRDDELETLLEQYDDDASVYWTYTRALTQFSKEGDSKRARSTLKDAISTNAYVALYLLGRKNVLTQALHGLDDPYGYSQETEAATYFMTAIPKWLKTPGAIDWIRENTDEKHLSELEQELA